MKKKYHFTLVELLVVEKKIIRFGKYMLILLLAMTAAAEEIELPLNLFKVPFWKEFVIRRQVTPAQLNMPFQALYVELQDLDDTSEAAILVNGFGPIAPPESCMSDVDNLPGVLILPSGWLRPGENRISFFRTSDLNGKSKGFEVHKAEFLFAESENVLLDKINAFPSPFRQVNFSRPVPERYDYTDDFQDEPIGKSFSHWVCQGGEWQVAEQGGNRFLELSNPAEDALLLLHAYGQETIFSGRFQLDKITPETRGIWFLVRCCFWPDSTVQVGYNFETSSWELIENVGRMRRLMKRFPAKAPSEDWHTFRLEMLGDHLRFSCDEKEILKAENLYTTNYGRVGVVAQKLGVALDDVHLRCESIPMDGIREYLFPTKPGLHYAGSACVVKLQDGRYALLMNNGGTACFYSKDQGVNWEHALTTPFFFGNIGIERLNDGRLISAAHRGFGNTPPVDIEVAFSENDGQSWSKPILISDGKVNVAMNGKITVASSGRIFIPVSKAEGAVGEKSGGVAVYYSDDGQKWQRSKRDLDLKTTGWNLQEAQVVELTKKGNLMLVMRCEKPFLCASYSTNNGETWSDPKPLPLPSVMCAFGIRRAPDGVIYAFWTFDDPSQYPGVPQVPRERIALAESRNDGKSWQFLGDVDAFGGDRGRFMNLGLMIVDDYLFLTSTVFRVGPQRKMYVKLWRIERKKLKPYPKFPTLH